jgi:hypothetical protein
MRFSLPAALAVALLTGSATAASSSFIGPGLSSCGTWSEHRHGIRGKDVEADEMWVLGFLSGIGFQGQSAGVDPLKEMDGA